MKTSILGLAVVAVMAGLPAGDVQAIQYDQNASGTCNGALPAFDQSLRFRPLAVANEASTNAFVSCTQVKRGQYTTQTSNVSLFLHNASSASVTVNCIYRPGDESFGQTPTAFPKAITLAAGEKSALAWDVNDNGGTPFTGPNNFSCNLPGKVELEFLTSEDDTDLI